MKLLWGINLSLGARKNGVLGCNKTLICMDNVFLVTLTQKIEDSNPATSKISSNESSDVNTNEDTVQQLPKNDSPPVVVQMPSVIQPLVISSSNSSPLPSTSSLFMTPLRQSLSVVDSCVPNDFSYVNTISNVSSPSDRQVTHTYVSSIKSSQVK